MRNRNPKREKHKWTSSDGFQLCLWLAERNARVFTIVQQTESKLLESRITFHIRLKSFLFHENKWVVMQSNLCGKATVGTDLKYPSTGYIQLYESRGNVTIVLKWKGGICKQLIHVCFLSVLLNLLKKIYKLGKMSYRNFTSSNRNVLLYVTLRGTSQESSDV